MNPTRYARQQCIWTQEKLLEARAIIYGANLIAQMTLIAGASMGIGDILISSDQRCHDLKRDELGFLKLNAMAKAQKGMWLSRLLAQMGSGINPEIKVRSLSASGGFTCRESVRAFPHGTLLICCSADLRERYIAAFYGQIHRVPVIIAGTRGFSGALRLLPEGKIEHGADDLLADYTDEQPGILPSTILAGLIGLMIVSCAEKADGKERQSFDFDAGFGTGISEKSLQEALRRARAKLNVCVVGAGGLGTVIAPILALLGIGERMSIIDPDMIELTNLNRQFLYSRAVGEAKASTLSRAVTMLRDKKGEIRGIQDRIENYTACVTGDGNNGKPVLFSAVDSLHTRLFLGSRATSHRINMINAGTSALAGQVSVYVPGISPCFSCRLDPSARQRTVQRRCFQDPDPSTILSNLVIGALAVYSLLYSLISPWPAELLRQAIGFDAKSASKIGLYQDLGRCRCDQ